LKGFIVSIFSRDSFDFDGSVVDDDSVIVSDDVYGSSSSSDFFGSSVDAYGVPLPVGDIEQVSVMTCDYRVTGARASMVFSSLPDGDRYGVFAVPMRSEVYVHLCDLDGAPLRGYVMEDLRFVVNTNGLPVGCDVDRVQVVGGSAVRDVGRVDLSDDCGFIVVSETYPVRSVGGINRVVLEFLLVSPDGVRNEMSLSMRSDGVWKESWSA